MAVVHLPRSLIALFPSAPRQLELEADDVDELFQALDRAVPGMRERLVGAGPSLREHLNVFVDGEPATLATRLTASCKAAGLVRRVVIFCWLKPCPPR